MGSGKVTFAFALLCPHSLPWDHLILVEALHKVWWKGYTKEQKPQPLLPCGWEFGAQHISVSSNCDSKTGAPTLLLPPGQRTTGGRT